MWKLQKIPNKNPAMCHIFFIQPLPFFSGFFFLFSSLGGGLWTAAAAAAAAAGGAEGAGAEGVEGVGFELHSTAGSPDGMATSRTTGRMYAKC